MTDVKNRRLGRGLAALIGDDAPASVGGGDVRTAPTAFLKPNPKQPRRRFAEEDLEELTRSIAEKGIIQPIVVRQLPGDGATYEIVAGERRWRAAQAAQLHEVPIVVKEFDDKEALEVAIIENVQRADLNPVEEAAGYERLMAEFGYTQADLSKIIGKSRSHVANMVRLLGLPEGVRAMLQDGRLTGGQARPLVGADNAQALAEQIVEQGLSAREAEALTRQRPEPETRRPSKKPSSSGRQEKDVDTLALEKNLTDTLGLRVKIHFDGENGGEVRVAYKSLEQLDDICQRLSARAMSKL